MSPVFHDPVSEGKFHFAAKLLAYLYTDDKNRR